jgi:His/Glu/Gln/Arg/opine family amino acid ABC transporter permease subunit
MNIGFIATYLPRFVDGAVITLELSILAIIISMVWGLVLAFGRLSGSRALRFLTSAYIEVVRNTPVLIQIYFIYFGLSMAGLGLSGFISGLIALSLQNGGYLAEIYRAGIQSISVTQVEGARALGMTRWLVFRLVVLPQALARVIPPIGNQLIVIIKDSSLVSTIAVVELTQVGKLLTERTAATYEVFIIVAVLYLIMTSIVTGLLRLYEGRHAVAH